MNKNMYFHKYFEEWVNIYKLGAVRKVTYDKYLMTLRRVKELAGDLKIKDLNRRSYQHLLNEYAKTHERATTQDFHHQLRGSILDAVDEGLLTTDPTRRAVVKGKQASEKKIKFLSYVELQSLLKCCSRRTHFWDFFILLLAKTGLRFSEALGLTVNDIDFEQKKIKISKTWNYKNPSGGFDETKNESSKRIIAIDDSLSEQLRDFTLDKTCHDSPIFVRGRIFNSMVNDRLNELCKQALIPEISLHGLRHTHASLLIYAGVSIASIAKRLGHSNTTTTQETYLHIIKELESKDNEIIIGHLAGL